MLFIKFGAPEKINKINRIKKNKYLFSQPNLLHTDLQNKKSKINKVNKKKYLSYLFY